MLAEEQLLGLSSLLVQEADEPSAPSSSSSAPHSSAVLDDPSQLPRFLFSFGLSPSGVASADALLSLLHHEGMKAVDARLKEAGVKSIGQRLKIQTAVQKGLDASSSAPPPPVPLAPPPPKPIPAHEILDDARAGGADVEALLELAGSGDRSAVSAELKRLGYKTGARLKLEQALTTVAAERGAEKNARCVREAAMQAHEEAQAAKREAAAKAARAAALAAAEAERARKEEMAELYARYERETMSEVDKLKAARKEANAAKRDAASSAQEAGAAASAAASSAASAPLLVDAPSGNGGVQGLQWHDALLTRDGDGDEAHAFFDERDPAAAAPASGGGGAAAGGGAASGGESSDSTAAAWLHANPEDHTGRAADLNQYWYSAATIEASYSIRASNPCLRMLLVSPSCMSIMHVPTCRWR